MNKYSPPKKTYEHAKKAQILKIKKTTEPEKNYGNILKTLMNVS